MIYHSNCKINIGLDIISKREDGFHNLSSLFYPVYGLQDRLTIEIDCHIDDIILSQSGIKVDCDDEHNLCVKAYRRFKEQCPMIGGVRVDLNKITPFGAGLGGGSANAAAVIMALKELFNIEASQSELCSVAKLVGSDVPFFIVNSPTLVSGTGDVFADTSVDLSGYHIAIIKPEVGVSTKEAYAMITPAPSLYDLNNLSVVNFTEWQNLIKNDFEKPIFAIFPILDEIKRGLLAAGYEFVMMSGSGSSVYGISKEFRETPHFDGCFKFGGIL